MVWYRVLLQLQSSDKVQMNGSIKQDLTIDSGHMSDDENYESILPFGIYCICYHVLHYINPMAEDLESWLFFFFNK